MAKEKSKFNFLSSFGTLFLVTVGFLLVFTFFSGRDQSPVEEDSDIEVVENEQDDEINPDITGGDNDIISDSVRTPSDTFEVLKVVAGDNIKIDVNGEVVDIRLIGVDAPNIFVPLGEPECYATESADILEEILDGNLVSYKADESQGDTDRYGNLLRYVYIEDGDENDKTLNEILIERGLVYEYTYDEPYLLRNNFLEAEKKAKNEGIGLWSICS